MTRGAAGLARGRARGGPGPRPGGRPPRPRGDREGRRGRPRRRLVADRLGTPVLVALGGDVATAGPDRRWEVLVSDGPANPRRSSRCPGGVRWRRPAPLARWRCGTREVHHVLDPRTLLAADPVWRTVSVAAASCVEANTASTAALVRGRAALRWFADAGSVPAASPPTAPCTRRGGGRGDLRTPLGALPRQRLVLLPLFTLVVVLGVSPTAAGGSAAPRAGSPRSCTARWPWPRWGSSSCTWAASSRTRTSTSPALVVVVPFTPGTPVLDRPGHRRGAPPRRRRGHQPRPRPARPSRVAGRARPRLAVPGRQPRPRARRRLPTPAPPGGWPWPRPAWSPSSRRSPSAAAGTAGDPPIPSAVRRPAGEFR